MKAKGANPLHQDGGLPLMGPMFYLVQCDGGCPPFQRCYWRIGPMSSSPARAPAALGMGPRTSDPALRSRRAWGAGAGVFGADSEIRSPLLTIRK